MGGRGGIARLRDREARADVREPVRAVGQVDGRAVRVPRDGVGAQVVRAGGEVRW